MVYDSKTMKDIATQMSERMVKMMESKRLYVQHGRRFGKTDAMRKQMEYYYTTSDNTSTANNYTITTTGTTYPGYVKIDYDRWYNQPVAVWGDATKKFIDENKETDKMEKCHLCGEDLVNIDTFEWREHDCECTEEDACDCNEWVWKKRTEKKFACGTIKREGDVEGKRVTLGEECIELG